MTAAASVFSLHLEKVAQLPAIAEGKNLPYGLAAGLERLERFFSRKLEDRPQSQEGRLARQILLYHTRHGGTRLVRDQFNHSCHQVLRVLLASVNVQRNNGPLGFLQVRRVRLTELSDATGFARSTVIAVVRALTRAGVLRTKRRKTDERDAELVAVRWITPALFDMLGLGGWIKKQSRGDADKKAAQKAAETKKAEMPGADRTRDDKPQQGRMAGLYEALTSSGAPPPKRSTDTPPR